MKSFLELYPAIKAFPIIRVKKKETYSKSCKLPQTLLAMEWVPVKLGDN
jgi:hypothetical protein